MSIEQEIWGWRQEQAQKARRRRIRRIWLAVIVVGVALLALLALTERAAGACQQVSAMGQITNVSQVIYPFRLPVRWYVAGRTFGTPTWFFGVTTRTRYQVGQQVLVSGCQGTEGQLMGVTLRRP